MGFLNRKKGKHNNDDFDFAINHMLEDARRQAESSAYLPKNGAGSERGPAEESASAADGISPWNERKSRISPPHVLTRDELLQTGKPAPEPAKPAVSPETIPMQPGRTAEPEYSPAALTLYQRMMQAKQKEAMEEAEHPRPVSAAVPEEQRDVPARPAQPKEESLSGFSSGGDGASKPAAGQTDKPPVPYPPLEKPAPAAPAAQSLLSKMKNYLYDAEDGQKSYVPSEHPRYTLDSVDDIIHSVESKAKERVAKLYGDALSEPDDAGEYKLSDFSAPPKPAGTADKFWEAAPQGSGRPAASGSTSEPAATVFSASAPAAPSVRVTPVRKARVFTTPEGNATTMPGSTAAKEIPVQVSVISPEKAPPAPGPGSVPADAARGAGASSFQYSYADENLPPIPELKKGPSAADTQEISLTGSAGRRMDGEGRTIRFGLDDIGDSSDRPDEDWEEEYRRARKQAAKKFVLFGDTEEENLPDEMPPVKEQPDEPETDELEDYHTFADAGSIRLDLLSRRRRLIARLIPTLLITGALGLLASPLADFLKTSQLTVYLAIHAVLLCAAALINLNAMKGLGSLFRLRPDMDAPAALAVTAVLIHSAVVWASGTGAAAPPLGALAALALLFNGIGKLTMISRIHRNFGVIATPDEKQAVTLIENSRLADAIAGNAVIGDALICASRKTVNVGKFLQNSYSEEPYERLLPILTSASAGLAVVSGIAAAVVLSSFSAGVTLFAAVFCLACPPTSLLLCNLPLRLMAGRLSRYDAMVAGCQSAEDLSFANAIVMDANQLFPAGTVKLYKMHLLSAVPIDQVILEAASMLNDAKSPLFDVFHEMLEGQRVLLPKISAVTCEDKMGLSGWAGDQRIFVGNRTLMEAHDIRLPSIEVDRKILRGGYFPLYLATGGKPAALFIVGYEADEDIARELRRLTATGVTVLVNSPDPNVNESMICDYFGLYDDSVSVVSATGTELYRQAAGYLESVDAPAAYSGPVSGLAAILTACIRLKGTVRAATAIQIIGMILGLALAGYFAFSGQLSMLTALTLGAYQLICSAVTCLVPYLRRP